MYRLVENYPEVGEAYELADEISIELFGKTKKIEGKSLSEHAREASDDELANNTVITQPLIVTTTVGLIKYLRSKNNYTTAYGHSLGELAALFAAGSISERDAIALAMLRGVYSRDVSIEQPSGMAALLNLPSEVKERLHLGEEAGVVLATENSPDQFTISGHRSRVDAVVADIRNRYQRVKGLTKEEKRQLPNAVKLKIEGGFHSFIMRPTQVRYRKDLDNITIRPPTEMNFFSNHSHDYEGDPDKIREQLVSQLIHPVLFWRDIGQLILGGHSRIVEAGPGSVLTTELREQQQKGRLPNEVEFLAAEQDLLNIAA